MCLNLRLKNLLSFAVFKTAEMPDTENTCEVRGFISFCGFKSLPKV